MSKTIHTVSQLLMEVEDLASASRYDAENTLQLLRASQYDGAWAFGGTIPKMSDVDQYWGTIDVTPPRVKFLEVVLRIPQSTTRTVIDHLGSLLAEKSASSYHRARWCSYGTLPRSGHPKFVIQEDLSCAGDSKVLRVRIFEPTPSDARLLDEVGAQFTRGCTGC